MAAVIDGLPGSVAIGHNRYATCGASMLRNVQPIFADLAFGGFAVHSVLRRDLRLPFFGVLRLDPSTMIDGPDVILLDPGGEVALSLTLPDDRALIGAQVFCQALLVSGNDLAEWRLTNVVGNDVVGN